MILLIVQSAGSVALPERLREWGTDILSPEADVLEHQVTELAQFLLRTGTGAPQLDCGDDPPDYHERRDIRRCLSAFAEPNLKQ
jgi:hypothetical protein